MFAPTNPGMVDYGMSKRRSLGQRRGDAGATVLGVNGVPRPTIGNSVLLDFQEERFR